MTLTRWGFGLGTLGRDMVAALVSMYLMFYLTDVLDVSGAQLAAITVILVLMRIFDAVNDPFMGVIVDNTHTRWGKFRPWIFWGALAWADPSAAVSAWVTGTSATTMANSPTLAQIRATTPMRSRSFWSCVSDGSIDQYAMSLMV